MRIRKLRLASLQNATTTSSSSVAQVHVCGFNQSPWDVITDFSPPSSPMLLLPPSPKVNGNAVIENSDASISVMEWEECDDDVTGQEFGCTDSEDVDGGDMADVKSGGKTVVMCCKTDGKNWKCKREAVSGNTLCEHHVALASKLSSDKKKKLAVVVEMESGKKRVRTKKPSAAAANPNDIYYYSGFGPRWNKKRGNDKEDDGNDNNLSTKSLEQEPVKEPSPTKYVDEVLDYIEDDDDEMGDGFGKRKRARKPVKARSLKSLM